MLQAARAQSLGLRQDSAYSWGLNRAIFYAAAKRGFRGAASTPGSPSKSPTERTPAREPYFLGDEEAFRDPKAEQLLFTIGNRDQTPADFEHQVASRFGTEENFQAAWKEAERIVAGYDRATLESRQHFFNDVYKPRRDDLSETWSREFAPSDKVP